MLVGVVELGFHRKSKLADTWMSMALNTTWPFEYICTYYGHDCTVTVYNVNEMAIATGHPLKNPEVLFFIGDSINERYLNTQRVSVKHMALDFSCGNGARAITVLQHSDGSAYHYNARHLGIDDPALRSQLEITTLAMAMSDRTMTYTSDINYPGGIAGNAFIIEGGHWLKSMIVEMNECLNLPRQ